jgi:hypothetical protein
MVGTYVWGNTPWSRDVTPQSPGYVEGNSNSHHVFSPVLAPPGFVFRPRTISLSTQAAETANYMIELLVNVPPHVGAHYHGIARIEGAAGTPVLHVSPADCARLILLPGQPGERLSGRALGSVGTMNLMLLWSGWLYPESALPRLLGMEAAATSGELPDLSRLGTAADALVVAAQGLSASVPR